MSGEGKHVETVLDQFGPNHLYPRGRLFTGTGSGAGRRAACAVQRSSPYGPKVLAPLPGCCEFATGFISEGAENRTCSIANGSFCPAKVFKDPAKFEDCHARKEKLSAEQT
jgi:hypothetical protein